jgi:hypothetical protein
VLELLAPCRDIPELLALEREVLDFTASRCITDDNTQFLVEELNSRFAGCASTL